MISDYRSKRIGLAFSGGGFRATLYHLGVVRFFRDAGMLPAVSHITSVSGGSIFAAHLVLNWDRYSGTPDQFDAAAAEILRFTRLDVRNRIVRRFPLAMPIQFSRWALRLGSNHRITRTGLLEAYYQNYLYGDTCLFQLPEQPYLHILSTNLTEGALCSFNRDGVIVQKRMPGDLYRFERMHTGLATLALAVTASSAFPGFFPPLQVEWREVGAIEGQFNRQVFTDGGVFDNLGVRMFRNLERTWLGREAELSRRDFYDVRCVAEALGAIENTEKSSPVARLAQLYTEVGQGKGVVNGKIEENGDTVIENLRRVVAQSALYREPSFEEVKPDDPEAVALLHSVRDSGKELEYHDRSWLNRQLLETVLRQVTGKRCMRPMGAMFDQVLVSDAGKHLSTISEVHAMGMISTALRASDIGLDRVWQLEKETFRNQPGFMFLPISRVVARDEDPTAPHPEIQRRMQEIRTDMDGFSSLEISTLVRHGYCVARTICSERRDWGAGDWPTGPPWDPDERAASNAARGTKRTVALLTGNRGPADDVVVARELQRSAQRKVWTRLIDWRDWTSYVYVTLIMVLLSIAPVGLYHWLQIHRQNRETEQLVNAITRTDPDQRAVLDLVRGGAPPAWSQNPNDEATILLPISDKGLVFTSERQIIDLRSIAKRANTTSDKTPDEPAAPTPIYARRRIRFHKTADYPAGQPAIYRFSVPAVSVEARVVDDALHPRLRRLRANQQVGRQSSSDWELQLDLSKVPVNEPVDATIEVLVSDPLPSSFWSKPRLPLSADAPVKEFVVWILLPTATEFDHFGLLEVDPAKPGEVTPIHPSTGIENSRGEIIHWSLFSPETGKIYECHWDWRR